ncbi:tripartite tricarboxylate transporter substrate binding protein [Saccharopolyspora sp. K220]|uniref:tripartite tricarboxylate transporter substrate binding protein n=1 Tax=Saccharopolyspora soli TaxID=2926618 RepID=UPI001F5651F4|nr:tripartite tricarboxylate transporter substrate binding protein [Saccharopolyspora soli]MCI2418400.1 tripartite tricarboxylate transporter substrate binding protein [Saccharopolyspora soli]
MKRTPLAAALSAALLCLSACGTLSNSDQGGYPKQGDTVQLLLGLSAGGTTDTWARILADELSQKSGAKFQVVNKPGSGGQLAINELLAKKDTNVIANVNLPTALKYLYPNAQANYSRQDFSLVGCTGYTPNVIAVHADSPYRTLSDLLNDIHARPGKVNAAADGALSDDTVAYANFARAASANFNTVVVDGASEKVTALLGKQVDFFSGGLTGLQAQYKAGQFRILAALADQRSPYLPDVPTAKEQGVDLLSDSYFCVTMAADAPEQARASLENAMREVSADPKYQEANAKVGMQVKFLDGQQLSALWAQQENNLREVIKTIG